MQLPPSRQARIRLALATFASALVVAALVYALTAAFGPTDYGLRARSVSDGVWTITQVVPGGVGWREGAKPGARLIWDAPVPNGDAAVSVIDAPGRGLLLLLGDDGATGSPLPRAPSNGPLVASLVILSLTFAAGAAQSAYDGRGRSLLPFPASLAAVGVALALGSVAPAGGVAMSALLFSAVALSAGLTVALAFVMPVRGPFGGLAIGLSLGAALAAVAGAMFGASLTVGPALYELAWAAAFLVAGLGIAALLAKSLVTLQVRSLPRDRRAARVIVATALAATAPVTLLSLFPAIVVGRPLVPFWATLLPIALVPLAVTHIAVPTRRIGLQRGLRQLFVHALAWILLATAYAGLVVPAGERVTGNPSAPIDLWVLVALLLGLGIAFPFARRVTLRVLGDAIYQDVYDAQFVMRTASVALASAVSPEELRPRVLEPVRAAVGLDWIAVTRARAPYQILGASEAPTVTAPVAGEISSAVAAATRTGTSRIGAAVVPCEIGGDVVGYLVAAVREETFGLSAADAELLAALAAPLASFALRVDLWHQLQVRIRELDVTSRRLRDSQQTLGELYEQVNALLEQERRRIATDLHDEPLQKLVLLQRALRSSAPGPYRSREALLGLVDDAASDLRTICERLRPPILDDLGLEAAIRWLAAETERAAPFRVEVRIQGTPDLARISPEVETNLYRALQELLTNAVRHASASRVVITFTRAADAIRLVVVDDGVGFEAPPDFSAYAATGHLGLVGVNERISRLTGTVGVTSAPGGPTSVRIDVPLPITVDART